MKKKDTLGTLFGNAPSDALDVVTPTNKHGGLYPGQAQPTGTRMMGFGEPGTAERFNRALAAVQKNVDSLVGHFSSDEVAVRRFTKSEIAALTAVNAGSVAISTIAAPFDKCYLYVGPNADQMGVPIGFAYGADAVARREGQPVYATISDIDNGGVTSYLATNTLAEALRDHLPDMLTTPIAIGTVAAGSFASQLFYRDGVRLTATWKSVHALRGAYLKIGGNLNAGWWRIIDFSDDGYTAIVNKTATKKIFVDTTSGSGLAAWTATKGVQFTGPSNQVYYLMDTEDLGGGLGILHVYPFSGTTRNGYPINDVRSLALSDTLTSTEAVPITIDVVAAGTVYEETDESILLDIGASSGPSTLDVYCPPGFVPLGCGVNVTVDFSENLPYAGAGAGEDLVMYGAVLMQPDDKMRSGGMDDSDIYATQQESLHPAYLGLMFDILSRAGTNGDRKLRVVTHINDASEYQISVVDTATGSVVFGVYETGQIMDGLAAAPFNFYRSEEVSLLANISMGQAIEQVVHTPALLNDPGFSRNVGPETISYNDIHLRTAGQYEIIPAGTIANPGWGATTTYYIYYDASAQAMVYSTTASDVKSPGLAGSGDDYPTGGDVLLAKMVTDGASAIDTLTTARRIRGIEDRIYVTVGGKGDFDTISDAVAYLREIATTTVIDAPTPFIIRLLEKQTITSTQSLIFPQTVGGWDTPIIIEGGVADIDILFDPAGGVDMPMFQISLGSWEFRDLKLDYNPAVGALVEPLIEALYFQNLTLRRVVMERGSGYPGAVVLVKPVAVNVTANDVLLEGCKFYWDDTGLQQAVCVVQNVGAAKTLTLDNIHIRDCEFWYTGGAVGGEVVHLDPTALRQQCVLEDVRIIGDQPDVTSAYTGIYVNVENAVLNRCFVESCALYAYHVGPGGAGTKILDSRMLTYATHGLTSTVTRGVFGEAGGLVLDRMDILFEQGLGIDIQADGCVLRDCKVSFNTVDANYGGGIYIDGIAPKLSNCIVEGHPTLYQAVSPGIELTGTCASFDMRGCTAQNWSAGDGTYESGVAGAITAPAAFTEAAKVFTGFADRVLCILDQATESNLGVYNIATAAGANITVAGAAPFGANDAACTWAIPAVGILVRATGYSSGNTVDTVGGAGAYGLGICFLHDGALQAATSLGDRATNTLCGIAAHRVDLRATASKVYGTQYHGIICRAGKVALVGCEVGTCAHHGIFVDEGAGAASEADGSRFIGNTVSVYGTNVLGSPSWGLFCESENCAFVGNTTEDAGIAAAYSIYIGESHTALLAGNALDLTLGGDHVIGKCGWFETFDVVYDVAGPYATLYYVPEDNRNGKLYADLGGANRMSKVLFSVGDDFLTVYHHGTPSTLAGAAAVFVNLASTNPVSSLCMNSDIGVDGYVNSYRGRRVKIRQTAVGGLTATTLFGDAITGGGWAASTVETGRITHQNAGDPTPEPVETVYRQVEQDNVAG